MPKTAAATWEFPQVKNDCFLVVLTTFPGQTILPLPGEYYRSGALKRPGIYDENDNFKWDNPSPTR